MKMQLIGNIVEINGERLLTVHHDATEVGRMRLEDFIKEVNGLRSAYSRGYVKGWDDRDEIRAWDDEEPK